MYQRAQHVQSTLFPPMYFDLVIADVGWGETSLPYLFVDRELLLIDLKLGTHTN